MKFRYKKFRQHILPPLLRPIIPIKIRAGDASIQYEVLVDSGADMCLFDAELCDVLGITLEDGEEKEVYGVTGVGEPYFNHRVILNIGGWNFETECGFKKNLASDYGIVGQTGFFEFFVVKFDYQKEQIDLKSK